MREGARSVPDSETTPPALPWNLAETLKSIKQLFFYARQSVLRRFASFSLFQALWPIIHSCFDSSLRKRHNSIHGPVRQTQ